ncbi:glycosyltransferase family 9 protein [Mucisphaera sp.]|uniref:glycosyltransferase family 9 protein n=1 Tax=Mucisphaera sp. TaxID=2913024 RepID=UPI003D12DD45
MLIVRPSALGDVARTVPALVALKQTFPQTTIDWLVHPAYADAIRCHPDLDATIPFDREGLSGFGWRWSATKAGFGLARNLRQHRYDRVYDLQGLARSGLYTYFSGCRYRVGFSDAREGARFAYNRRHRVNEVHTVDRMLGLLRADGVQVAKEPDLRLYTPPEEASWAHSYLQDRDIDPAEGYLCIAPTAQWGCKQWPLDGWAKLITRVVNERHANGKVLVLSAPHEAESLNPLRAALDTDIEVSKRVFFPETATVGRLMGLLGASSMVVSNDSAALHLAVGLLRPVVGIFGPTDPARVGPYGHQMAVVQPSEARRPGFRFDYRQHRDDPSLIAQVAVEAVWSTLERVAGTSADLQASVLG